VTSAVSARPGQGVHAAGVALLLALACGSITEAPPQAVFLYKGAGDQQAAEVATNLAQPLVVEIRDASGSPVKGVRVQFASDARGSRSTLAESDSLGRAWVWWQLGELAGPQVIRASLDVPNVSGETRFDALALPGPPAAVVVISGLILVALPGTELDTLDVLVTDRFTNPAANVSLSWTIEAGSGTIRALSDRTDSKGRARAIWKLGAGTGAQSVLVAAGNTTHRIRAAIAPVFSAVQVVSGSDHSCALTADGVAHCWGSNSSGQLGIGSRDRGPHVLPAVVQTSMRFKSLTAGVVHTCGLALDGTTWCWGDNRAQQVGSMSTDVATTPARLTTGPAFSMLAAGGFHTCGLTSDGVAYCWGDDSLGQLGRGTDRSEVQMVFEFGHTNPEPVAGSLVFSSIAANWSSTCGVTTSGTSYCWGENSYLILGSDVSQKCRIGNRSEYSYDEVFVSNNDCSTSPLRVATSTSVASLAMDQHGVCAHLTSSEVACWGRYLRPTVIPSARVSSLWSSGDDVCGVTIDDTVACWRSYAPFPRSDPLGGRMLVDLNTSGRHTCGLTRPPESAVYCWGTNYSGELGDGTTTQRDLPVAVIWPYSSYPIR
jgi:alpha-tubulin suppressor-like RCC1 family protein